MRRFVVPLVFGLVGAAILIGLGLWQLRRLEWKTAMLAQIDARIAGAPADLSDLPTTPPDPDLLRFAPVVVEGTTTGAELRVLTSRRETGPGYRIIAAFETDDGRRIMIDRGFLPAAAAPEPRGPVALRIIGNLHWPQETDSFTPPPDTTTGAWFARDVAPMAQALKTEPLMVIVRSAAPADAATSQGITALPIDSAGISNDHLNYALTWFSLALIWLGMTGLLLWRIRRRTM